MPSPYWIFILIPAIVGAWGLISLAGWAGFNMPRPVTFEHLYTFGLGASGGMGLSVGLLNMVLGPHSLPAPALAFLIMLGGACCGLGLVRLVHGRHPQVDVKGVRD